MSRLLAALEDLKDQYPAEIDLLEREIFKIANLTIGRKAPNIRGFDTNEVEFELTEYRGRVVVINFCGDW